MNPVGFILGTINLLVFSQTQQVNKVNKNYFVSLKTNIFMSFIKKKVLICPGYISLLLLCFPLIL